MLQIGSTGSVPLSFTVPADPSLRGRSVYFQGVVFPPGAPLPTLTNLGDLRLP